MRALRQALRDVRFRYGWDTRCRNLIPAEMLRSVLSDLPSPAGISLLDVGSGGRGIATFLPEVSAVGIDMELPDDPVTGFTFIRGDATAIPFPDRSFPLVSCVDMIEHMPVAARGRAIEELVRVSSRAVLVAFPHGSGARACDEEFRRACEERGRPVPGWAAEHLRQQYPTAPFVTEQVEAAAKAAGRRVKFFQSYCEPVWVSRRVRAAGVRSDAAFVAVSLLFGLLFKVLPTPGADDSYRAVVLALLDDAPASAERPAEAAAA